MRAMLLGVLPLQPPVITHCAAQTQNSSFLYMKVVGSEDAGNTHLFRHDSFCLLSDLNLLVNVFVIETRAQCQSVGSGVRQWEVGDTCKVIQPPLDGSSREGGVWRCPLLQKWDPDWSHCLAVSAFCFATTQLFLRVSCV